MTTVADTPPAAGAPPADPPQAPPGAPSPPVPPSDPPADPTDPREGDPPDVAAVRREAANYRRRLRDVELERDQLRGRVDEFERGTVERIAANAGMSTPADVWLLIPDLEQLRTDGQLNPDAVRERIAAILSERPSWRRPRPDYGSGARGNGAGSPKIGLSDLLRDRERRR